MKLVNVEALKDDYDERDLQVGDVCVALEAGTSHDGAPTIEVRIIRTGGTFELKPGEWEIVR